MILRDEEEKDGSCLKAVKKAPCLDGWTHGGDQNANQRSASAQVWIIFLQLYCFFPSLRLEHYLKGISWVIFTQLVQIRNVMFYRNDCINFRAL